MEQLNHERPDTGQRRVRGFRRSYKACNLCRRKKIRCVVDDARKGDGCLRCEREGKQCVFPVDRSHRESSPSGSAHGPIDESTWSQTWSPSIDSNQAPQTQQQFTQQMPLDGDGAAAGDLTHSVMRTLVSNGNDALHILFQAAAAEQGHPGDHATAASLTPGQATTSTDHAAQAQVPREAPSQSAIQLWRAFRFVKMGWFTAEEAVQYMDLFFRNIAPLSLVSRGMDGSHDGHFRLITQEPLLCCILLLISSRYHTLPQAGGVARSTLIHHRLWEHCQHLIMRIMFGQDKRSKARTRTKGSVEALLLLVEWHPRAIYFPPVSDGWDSTLLHSAFDPRDDEYGNREDTNDEFSPVWHRDVVRPARTSDRMAWMLLGCAQSLALELGICDTSPRAAGPGAEQPGMQAKHARVRELLYILMEQHSFRLGCPSMAPETLTRLVSERHPSDGGGDSLVAAAWLDLTDLLRSMHDLLFPSSAAVRDMLKTGRYVSVIKHFQQQLLDWKRNHLDPAAIPAPSVEELIIEYNHARAFMNSLGVQAVVDRVQGSNPASTTFKTTLSSSVRKTEHAFIREVIDGSLQVLESAKRLFATGALRFCPVRIYLRVISASIFLLKAVSLGTNAADLKTSLAYLGDCIACLRASSLDEVDLASRYGSLLELFLAKFEQGMVPASAPHAVPVSFEPVVPAADGLDLDGQAQSGIAGGLSGVDTPEDWFALPLSQSMAPFTFWGEAGDVSDPDEHLWDAMWNLPSL